MNVLGISCTGHTAMKLARKILNVLAIYRVGMKWVLCPFPCNVLAMSQPVTPPLAPSGSDAQVHPAHGMQSACDVHHRYTPTEGGSKVHRKLQTSH